MLRLRKPSIRTLCAVIVFFGLNYLALHFEHLALGPIVRMLNEYLHLQFRATIGPRPAVPVNLLTVIVVVRSIYALLITWLALRIGGGHWDHAGLSTVRSLRNYGAGLLIAFLSISFLVFLVWLSRGFTFDGVRLHGADIFGYGLRWLVGMILVGFEEECSSRGYGLLAVADILGPLPAALLTSLFFTVAHMGNPGETAFGLLQIFAFGLLCALNVFRTGSIWWAVAFHGIWDWTQEFFYGTLGSGYWFDGHLFQFRPRGPELISGGTVGPEGSMYVLFILAGLIFYEVMKLRRMGYSNVLTTSKQ